MVHNCFHAQIWVGFYAAASSAGLFPGTYYDSTDTNIICFVWFVYPFACIHDTHTHTVDTYTSGRKMWTLVINLNSERGFSLHLHAYIITQTITHTPTPVFYSKRSLPLIFVRLDFFTNLYIFVVFSVDSVCLVDVVSSSPLSYIDGVVLSQNSPPKGRVLQRWCGRGK